MEAQSWAALITAFGGGALLLEIVRAVVKAVSGRIGRERNAIDYERARADRIQKEADLRVRQAQEDVARLDLKMDQEILKRRAAESRAARFERLLILNGVRPSREEWTDENTVPRTGEEGSWQGKSSR